jgi:predicted metal-dependent hydrolase
MNDGQKASGDCWQDADELKWVACNWAARIGVKVPQIHLRQMSSKWASISTSGRLTLNSELLDIPKMLGEFVIVHEVVHIIAPNHGKVFKSFMFAYLPYWQEREQMLRDLERKKMLSKAERDNTTMARPMP